MTQENFTTFDESVQAMRTTFNDLKEKADSLSPDEKQAVQAYLDQMEDRIHSYEDLLDTLKTTVKKSAEDIAALESKPLSEQIQNALATVQTVNKAMERKVGLTPPRS